MYHMTRDKVRFGIAIERGIAKEIEQEVKAGKYMELNRSEVIEAMLKIMFANRKDKSKFSEYVRKEIIEKRKEDLRI